MKTPIAMETDMSNLTDALIAGAVSLPMAAAVGLLCRELARDPRKPAAAEPIPDPAPDLLPALHMRAAEMEAAGNPRLVALLANVEDIRQRRSA